MSTRNVLLAITLVAVLSAPALAGTTFVNGGFEAGDLYGWSTSSDNGTASWVAAVAGQTSRASSGNGGLSSVIVTPGADPIVGINRTYGGSYGVRVGDSLAWGYTGGGTFYNRIRQSATVAAETNGSAGFMYFAWAAVEQISNHSSTSTPFFQVRVTDTTTASTIYNVAHYEGDAGAWVNAGNGWKYSANSNVLDPTGWNVVSLDLAALGVSVGDNLTLEAIARDCSPTAHAMYVYLDGFGAAPPVVGPIPEPVTLLGVFLGVSGLAGYIRRRRLA